jgi:hypothetical protein
VLYLRSEASSSGRKFSPVGGGKQGRSSNIRVHAAEVCPNVKAINIFMCCLLVELDEEDELNWKGRCWVYIEATPLLLTRSTKEV